MSIFDKHLPETLTTTGAMRARAFLQGNIDALGRLAVCEGCGRDEQEVLLDLDAFVRGDASRGEELYKAFAEAPYLMHLAAVLATARELIDAHNPAAPAILELAHRELRARTPLF